MGHYQVSQVPADAYEPARQPKGARHRHEDVEDGEGAQDDQSPRDELPRTPPSGASLEEKLIAVVDMDNLVLPEIQSIPQRDPLFVLRNCVAVCPDIYEAQNRSVIGNRNAPQDLAPLVYMRKVPYTPRHPLDNDALRCCDANSRWLSA